MNDQKYYIDNCNNARCRHECLQHQHKTLHEPYTMPKPLLAIVNHHSTSLHAKQKR